MKKIKWFLLLGLLPLLMPVLVISFSPLPWLGVPLGEIPMFQKELPILNTGQTGTPTHIIYWFTATESRLLN